MRARATKPKHREDAYFLGEQLRAYTHTHTFEIPEGDAGVSRTISSDSATYGGPAALFSTVFPRIYIRMVAAFPEGRKRGKKSRLVDTRPGEFSERTDAKDVLEDIQHLRRRIWKTRNVTHFVHCVHAYLSHYSILGVESFDRSCFLLLVVLRCSSKKVNL